MHYSASVLVCLQVLNGTGSQDGNYAPSLRNFSISQKEKALNELVQDKWLNRTPDGNVVLGVRSFLDLRSWFRSNDVPSCEVCNEAGVKVVFMLICHGHW